MISIESTSRCRLDFCDPVASVDMATEPIANSGIGYCFVYQTGCRRLCLENTRGSGRVRSLIKNTASRISVNCFAIVSAIATLVCKNVIVLCVFFLDWKFVRIFTAGS